MKYTANKIINFGLGVSSFLVILVSWQLLHAFNVIPSWFISGPKETFLVFLKLLLDGTLPRLLSISFLNIFPAFIMAIIASLFFGILIGVNAAFRKIFTPFLSAIYLVPSLAWLPLIILFFGFSRQTIWAVIFISSFVRIIYNVIGGVKGINLNWLLAAQNLGIGKFGIVIKVIFPGALPQILSGIRVGFGSAWRSLVGAEMLVVTAGGLGKYIWASQWSFNFEQVLSGIIMIAMVGIMAELIIFKWIEKITLAKWGLLQN
jgi:ABC-type nitrate/sulfonate/bicarbonate transport system permease component